MTEQRFTLIANLAGSERADKYLSTLIEEEEDAPTLTRSQIQRLIENNSVLVNGKPIRSKDKIPYGAEITLIIPAPSKLEVVPEDIPLHILYEDEHLVVVNKQPGLTVHPSETQKTGTLVNALVFHIKDLSGIGGTLRPGIVHRIDKDTSGAIVISKTDAAHQGLSKLFATHDIERKYLALCYGAPKWETKDLKTFIGRSNDDRKKMAVHETEGRVSISHFKCLRQFGVPEHYPFASLVEARLETGRTHQIRVHMNHLHHSLLGDPLYGTPTSNQAKWKNLPHAIQECVSALSGQALHAETLGFVHPITGERLSFQAEPFQAFKALLSACETYA